MSGNSENTAKLKIMIVDDEQLIVNLLQAILTKEGYEVVAALNGQEAVHLAKEQTPNLIIMDIGMPVMDGYQATAMIRALPNLARTPVIFLSGKSAEEDKGRSFAEGGLMFVRKPFTAPQIRDLIRLTAESLNDSEVRA